MTLASRNGKRQKGLAIRPKAQPKQVRRPNLEPTMRAIDAEDPSKDLEFAQLPGRRSGLAQSICARFRAVTWNVDDSGGSPELTSHLRGTKS